MKNQSQAGANATKSAAPQQSKSSAASKGRGGKSRAGGLTFSIQDCDDHEIERVSFDPELSARLLAAAARLHISPASFLLCACSEKMPRKGAFRA